MGTISLHLHKNGSGTDLNGSGFVAKEQIHAYLCKRKAYRDYSKAEYKQRGGSKCICNAMQTNAVLIMLQDVFALLHNTYMMLHVK